MTFPSPVPVNANTTYVASYHAPNGGYSRTVGYFVNPFARYPLLALGGGNGVYAYGPAGTFPSNTFGSTNYFVDVIFTTAP